MASRWRPQEAARRNPIPAALRRGRGAPAVSRGTSRDASRLPPTSASTDPPLARPAVTRRCSRGGQVARARGFGVRTQPSEGACATGRCESHGRRGGGQAEELLRWPGGLGATRRGGAPACRRGREAEELPRCSGRPRATRRGRACARVDGAPAWPRLQDIAADARADQGSRIKLTSARTSYCWSTPANSYGERKDRIQGSVARGTYWGQSVGIAEACRQRKALQFHEAG